MSSDLVAYKKPRLIETLQDVLDSEEFEISFTQHANLASRFQKDRPGSLEHRIYERSIAQWAPFKEKKGLYLHALGSDEFIDSPNIIRRNNIAFLCPHIPAGIIVRFECKDMAKPKFGDDPVPYSSLYPTNLS